MKILKKAYEFVKDAGSFLRGSIMIVLCFTIVIFGIWNTILSMGVTHSHREIKSIINKIKNESKADRKFFLDNLKMINKFFVEGEPITKEDKVYHNHYQMQWLKVMLGIVPSKKNKLINK